MALICHSCGTVLPDEARFCLQCATSTDNATRVGGDLVPSAGRKSRSNQREEGMPEEHHRFERTQPGLAPAPSSSGGTGFRIAVMILSLTLMLIVGAQSCLGLVIGGISQNEGIGQGSAIGILVAFLFLLGGALVLPVPTLSLIIFLVAGAFGLLAGATTPFHDLSVWGTIALVLAFLSYLGRGRRHRPTGEATFAQRAPYAAVGGIIVGVVLLLSLGQHGGTQPTGTANATPIPTAPKSAEAAAASALMVSKPIRSPAASLPPTTISVPATPTPTDYGTKDNPVPAGAYYTLNDHGAMLQVHVVDVVKNATSLVKQGNLLNQDPPAGNDYILVKLEARYFQGSNDTPYTTSSGNTRFLAQSRLWGAPVISIAPQPQFEGNDIFPGAVVSGWLPGKYLPTDVMDSAVLEYQGVYFSLAKQTSTETDQKLEPLPTPNPAVASSASLGSRFHPIPLGTQATITDQGNKIEVSVSNVIIDADQQVKAASPLNPDPPSGYQYILVRAKLRLLAGSSARTYHTSDAIRFYAADRLWGGGSPIVPPEPRFGAQDIFPGATVDGWIGARYLPKELAANATMYYQCVYFALK